MKVTRVVEGWKSGGRLRGLYGGEGILEKGERDGYWAAIEGEMAETASGFFFSFPRG